MARDERDYVKNGIKFSWLDLKHSFKYLFLAIYDLIVGLSKLLWLKIRGVK